MRFSNRVPTSTMSSESNQKCCTHSNPIYIILGSGGHTAEMCKISQALFTNDNATKYLPVRYVVAKSDMTSRKKLLACNNILSLNQDTSNTFIEVPRSRYVGQSWISTIFTTLWSLLWCLWLIWRDQPKLILCNGPGTCVPFCYAARLWRLLGRLPKNSKIVFVESFCRVETLSLSGRLVMPIADMFVIQWPALMEQYKHKNNVKYFGQIM